jgi:hypothetical protein
MKSAIVEGIRYRTKISKEKWDLIGLWTFKEKEEKASTEPCRGHKVLYPRTEHRVTTGSLFAYLIEYWGIHAAPIERWRLVSGRWGCDQPEP